MLVLGLGYWALGEFTREVLMMAALLFSSCGSAYSSATAFTMA
jgi:hypothetical protein